MNVGGESFLVSGNRAASLDATTVSANGQHLLQIASPDGLNPMPVAFSRATTGASAAARPGCCCSIDQLDTPLKRWSIKQYQMPGLTIMAMRAPVFPTCSHRGCAAALVHGKRCCGRSKAHVLADRQRSSGDNRNALALVNYATTQLPLWVIQRCQGTSFLGSLGEQAQASQNSVDFQNQSLTRASTARRDSGGVLTKK